MMSEAVLCGVHIRLNTLNIVKVSPAYHVWIYLLTIYLHLFEEA
jgi:hypothetical protein